MDEDNLIKEKQDNFNGPLNILENETVLSETKEEMDPMPVYDEQIKDDKDPLVDCDVDENQENSNTDETVNKTHLSKPITQRCCIICGTQGTKHFYSFPTNKDRLELWLKSCGLEKVRQHDKICWKHFKSDDFFPRRSDNAYRCLKRNVVPSINLPEVRIKPVNCQVCGFSFTLGPSI